MKHKDIFIFDFDGVIVDSFDVCFDIECRMNPRATIDSFLKRFEGNVFSSLKETKIDDSYIHDYFSLYKKEILTLGIPEKRKETLQALSKKYDLAIVTSCAEYVVEPFLEKEDSLGFFDYIYGYETEKSKKKKFEMLFDVYKKANDSSLFITDSLGDLLEAQEVAVDTVAVTSGFHDEATLKRGNPSYIVSDLGDLNAVAL